MEGASFGIDAVVAGDREGTSGVTHGRELSDFVAALVRGNDAELRDARVRLGEALGPGGLVDAAAVASNFERMNRIADATGIPLDAPVALMTADLRDRLHLDRFASAAHTRRLGRIGRAAAAAVRPLLSFVLRRLGARRGAGAGATRRTSAEDGDAPR
jgi:hypothetical protein